MVIIDGGKEMSGIQTVGGGTINYASCDGVRYSVYIPANVNADTPIFTYTYGAGGTDNWWSHNHPNGNYGVYDALIEKGGDSIVVMPTMDWGADWGGNTMKIINSIRSEYGITNLNVSGSGFSKGGFGGFDIVAENIKQNPDIDPQVVFFIDDYSSTYYMARNKLTPEKCELFKNNNTTFFVFDPPWKSTDNYQTYLDAGINMVRVEPKDYNHSSINSNFFRNSMYDYMNGKSLPLENYTYKVYNHETKTWDVVDPSQVATVDKLYSYYGISSLTSIKNKLLGISLYEFASDRKELEGYLNNILMSIKSSAFLSGDIASFSGSSTTKTPSEIPQAIQEYFAKVGKVLVNIQNLTKTIVEVDDSYRDLDQDLVQEVENIAS